eukprot:5678292-Amphidinium_carterae.1
MTDSRSGNPSDIVLVVFHFSTTEAKVYDNACNAKEKSNSNRGRQKKNQTVPKRVDRAKTGSHPSIGLVIELSWATVVQT